MRKGRVIDLLIDLIFSKKKSVSYQRDYSKDWDATLNRILDEGSYKGEKNHCAHFNHHGVIYSIWSSNYPYSFGFAHTINGEYVPYSLQYRASERTMKRLYDFLNEPKALEEQERVNKMRKYITGKD